MAWYHANARPLPWRASKDPYRILLSELMCQQTRVDTAIPYFERFIRTWPTLEDFAAATEEEVVAAWAGLGYYRRARSLHRAACAAVELGGIPSDPARLKALPGIGPYTAGAIASIAFGVPAAAVDGNVERVVTRLDARPGDPKSKGCREGILTRVEEMHAVHDGDPGDLTQALMELGATVCTPRNPSCASCPCVSLCAAYREGEVARFPESKKRVKPKPMSAVSAVVVADGKVLACQRSGEGLLGGLWEPVMAEVPAGERGEAILRAVLARRAGLEGVGAREMGQVTHVFSHRRLSCWVYLVELQRVRPVNPGEGYQTMRWVGDLESVAWSVLGKKLLDCAGAPDLLESSSNSGSL